MNPIAAFQVRRGPVARAVVAAALAAVASLMLPICAHAASYVIDADTPGASDRNPGSADKPLKTLAEAARRIRPGDELVLAPGVYRETLTLPRLTAAADGRMTVIRARSAGTATLRGSDPVADWQALGDGRFASDWSRRPEPAQVFFRGQPLRQIGGTVFGGFPLQPGHELANLHASEGGIWPGRRAGGVAELRAGDFTFDRAAKRLVVRLPAGTEPGSEVEASARPFVLLAENVAGLRIEGLVLEHANTSIQARQGAVKVFGEGNVLSGLVIRHMDAIGLQLFGRGSRLIDSRIEDCGQMGLNARGRELLIAGNRFLRNNHRGFNKWWEAGGVKVIGDEGLHDAVFSDNVFAFNQGDGLWIDWMNTKIRIERNVAAYNSGFGIHYEASQDGTIEGNASYGNGQRGIYVFESSGTRVERNIVLANGLEGIVVADGERSASRPELKPRRNRVADNTIGWNKDIELMLPPPGLEVESDRNTLVAESLPAAVRGWTALNNRPARGLVAWRERTGLDVQSNERVLPRPAALQAILREREIVGPAALRTLLDNALAQR